MATVAMPEFLNLEEVGALAKGVMPQMAYDYYAGGAETQTSVSDNRTCFQQYRIVPRILVDVSKVTTSCELFGELLAAAQ
jgi:isopentenyl diphosphate isomerase/L-lactate dehydrogenase-like FMN-dependent dehydrogenase